MNSLCTCPRQRLSSIPSVISHDKGLSDIERLSLEKFSGKEGYWRSVFDVCIDQKPISKQNKMLRLLSCLIGEPKRLLASCSPTAASYDAALSRLDAEYGGDRRLLRLTISRIRDGKVIHVHCTW